ncbi:hypothetical protein Dsin_007976 [Dipteronia sinensis]|uniref:KIB1-4 beta-propeller domain-containing protein n=1 Tax=Dipteronia sinensis TaxID=43782 RepID=A0AAE0EHC7_9ROSI|nr:hypothetical protein Dsin_007976 [Dipteronia sinensis]
MANWEKLNHELLVEIADRIISLPDYVSFGGVCTSFRSAAPAREKIPIPLLMLQPRKDDHICKDTHIHGERGELSYIKAGDDTWTPINTWCGRYQDITYYKGHFYTVNCLGMVMTLSIRRDDPSEAEQVAEFPPSIEEYSRICRIIVDGCTVR